jgi:hypothetical protein
MFCLWNNFFVSVVRKFQFLNYFHIKIILLCAFSLLSCGFLDFRPITVTVQPGETDLLLPEQYSPVIISFNTEMEKKEAEGFVQINSDLGVVKGDRFWKDNDLYFVPVAGWTAGIRYTLSLSGTIHAVDGRELKIEKFISFYAINKSKPPLLERYSPEDGASVGTENIILEFQFSCPMERLTVETALSVEGVGNKKFEWLADDKTLKVTSEKALYPWFQYRWNLRDSAKSREGVPLPKAYSGFFTTDKDQTLPYVEKIFPVLNHEGRWFPTGADIKTGLREGQGIAVEFNKKMGENILRSIRFEPSLSGRAEQLSEKSIVYIFTKDPEPETIYTLIVSGDTKDSEGLKIGSDYRINFIPDIPFLKILSFKADGNPVVMETFSAYSVLQVPVTPAAGDIYFNIRFSMLFSEEEKQNSALKINLIPFYPRTIAPVALKDVNWITNDRLRMRWEGLTAGSGDEAHYYKLTIPGGKNGISSGTGIYMKEEIIIYLEAVE